MDVTHLDGLLKELNWTAKPVEPILGGWASWTFDLAGEYILRVARTPEIAQAHRREERLLPALAAAVDFEVPVPIRVGEYDGHCYMTYHKLPGNPLCPSDRLESVADMLRQLHAFPVPRAAGLLQSPGTAADWYARYRCNWEWIERDVLPALDSRLRDRVRGEFESVLSSLSAVNPTLVHRDLGTEHILVDPVSRVATGMIDFETAAIGDAAIDFVGLLVTLGAKATGRIINDYGSPISWERLRFYWWMGSIHAIHHGVMTDDKAIVVDGIAALRDRITADSLPQ